VRTKLRGAAEDALLWVWIVVVVLRVIFPLLAGVLWHELRRRLAGRPPHTDNPFERTL
jgi:hypothetical protein